LLKININLLQKHEISLKISIKSLEKSNMKSQYRNIFFGRFLHCTLETRWLGSSFEWFIETTLVCWVLASSVCA